MKLAVTVLAMLVGEASAEYDNTILLDQSARAAHRYAQLEADQAADQERISLANWKALASPAALAAYNARSYVQVDNSVQLPDQTPGDPPTTIAGDQMPVGELWASDPTRTSSSLRAQSEAQTAEAKQLIDRMQDARIRRDYKALRSSLSDTAVFQIRNQDMQRRVDSARGR